jgi:hypothetical protein
MDNRNVSIQKVRVLTKTLLHEGGFFETRNQQVYITGELGIAGVNPNQSFASEDAATDALLQVYFADELKRVA